MQDISNFCDIETVDILSGIVDSKLMVNLKTPDRTRAKRSNTNKKNITERPIYFNKFMPSENGKNDNKIHVIEHNKISGSI